MTREPLEDAYDAYLERCLAGDADDPIAYGAQVGAGPELQARLMRLHAMGTRGSQAEEVSAPFAAAGVKAGDAWDGFRLIEEIGSGGMGTVWLAEQVALGRRVALKCIRPELLTSESIRERLRREAHAVARLQHPQIVEVHAFGERDGAPWFAMAHLPGGTLREHLRDRGPLPWREAAALVLGLAQALQHAHAAGIVHRDVKPENVLFTGEQTPTLVDFGIARDALVSAGLTETFHGSPLYSAPEQLMGKPLDARCDIYALGCVLYECLTGRVPFVGASLEEVVRRCLSDEPLAPRSLVPSIPRDLQTVVLAAVAREPEQRLPTADALADDLEALLQGRPIRARPPGIVRRAGRWCRRHSRVTALLSVALLSLLIALGIGWQRARERERKAIDRIDEAQTLVDDIRPRFMATREQQRERDRLRGMLRSHFLDDEAARRLLKAETATRATERERDELHHRVLMLLREAERLGADPARVRAVRADLFGRRMAIASALNQPQMATVWRARAEAEQAGSTARYQSHTAFALTSDPPGATVELFHYAELADLKPTGDRRVVPVPPSGVAWPVDAGTRCLRALGSAGELKRGDLVVKLSGHSLERAVFVLQSGGAFKRGDRLDSIGARSIRHSDDAVADDSSATVRLRRGSRNIELRATDLNSAKPKIGSALELALVGDVPATVVRSGRVVEIQLPAKPSLVPSAAAPLGQGHDLGQTPVNRPDHPSSRMGYLALLRASGCRATLRPLRPDVGSTTHIRLERTHEARDGFVYVAAPTPFWMQRHEVTLGEYLPFLNAPETQAEIAASQTPIRFPRMPSSQDRGAVLRRDASGVWRIPPTLRADLPVFGVSFHDAQAYARWWARQQKVDPARVGVPRYEEWREAGGGNLSRNYVYGYWFWPRWMSSNFSRARPSVEPVMSYSIDESPYGVLDMAGSVMEWLDAEPINMSGVKRLGGGSWAQAAPSVFRIESELSLPPEQATVQTGFRLVIRSPVKGT